MNQLALDSWNATNAPELERVKSKIGNEVLSFLRWRMHSNRVFRMVQLTEYVKQFTSLAPDSPGRVMRDLRQRGLCKYKLRNRRASEYEVIEVGL